MKKIILLLIVALFYSTCPVCAAEEFSFRGVTWDMGKEDIKAVETGVLKSESGRFLQYDVEDFYQTQAMVFYELREDKLYEMAFIVYEDEKKIDLQFLKSKYYEIENEIKNKYSDIEIIEQTEYYGDPTHSGAEAQLYLITTFEVMLAGNEEFLGMLCLSKSFQDPRYQLYLRLHL